jgi:CRP-like cAMP-binding protein
MFQKSVKKGEFLQRKGDIGSKVYAVKSGLLRSYSIDEKGKEHIFMFAPEDWIISDTESSEIPSELFIDALEDSVVEVRDKNIERDQVSPEPLLKRILVLQKRVIMLMSASALERYQHFVETYPDIIQRVPQKMIASYLGITPEALSSQKSKLHKKKSQ